MSDLMSIFGISKRGMFAEQKALGVTSHNIANANTEGYSRQRVQRETTKPFYTPSMNSAIGPGQMGTGVEITAIDRVRDKFLDFQVRRETSTLGRFSARDKYLGEVESIFNEPTEYGLSTEISKFYEAWYSLSKQPESSNTRTVVAQQSDALAKELRHTYSQLEEVKNNVHDEIKQHIFDTNERLDKLNDLNQQIMQVTITKQRPNDLMDKRDLILDKLSSVLNIDREEKEFNAYDVKPQNTESYSGIAGNELLVRKDPNAAVSRFSYINNIEEKGTTLEISYLKLGDSNKVGQKITITGLTKDNIKEVKRHIDEGRVVWADKTGKAYSESKTIGFANFNQLDKELGLFNPNAGELKGLMTVQEDVDKYQEQLNKLAKGFAMSVNTVHSGNQNFVRDDKGSATGFNKPFFVNGTVDIKKPISIYDKDPITGKLVLNNNYTENLEKEITAENIEINKELLDDVMKIKTGTNNDDSKNGESDGNRALAIAQLQYTLMDYGSVVLGEKMDRSTFINKLTGKLVQNSELNNVLTIKNKVGTTKADSYFKDIVDELGIQKSEAKKTVTNTKTLLSSLQESRDSSSGVSLDEEMANLVQFQHAYQANAKMISIVDQLLDVVVNGLIK
ncbi:flagellar hook-associated protein FlgK [Hathewaya limosa]|uniref:Flagellar hook-associated protein 1 n=2 Tax=Hathewaya limosa TaxID=1536 RepID=A0ABU0JQ58_HATLI|nr:flagellar hook-associated protein 1 FlgK [Hathewaya limosa]